MGTTNRQFKNLPKMPYIKPMAPHLSKKEQAVLNNNLSSIDKRNDAFDAWWYSFATSTSSTPDYGSLFTGSTTSSATGVYDRYILGIRDTTEEKLLVAQKENTELRYQLIAYHRAKEIFIQVLTNVHVMLQELDLSDLRMTEPFQYRVKRNELDEIFNNVLKYMEQHDAMFSDIVLGAASNAKMIRYFEEKGLL